MKIKWGGWGQDLPHGPPLQAWTDSDPGWADFDPKFDQIFEIQKRHDFDNLNIRMLSARIMAEHPGSIALLHSKAQPETVPGSLNVSA